MYGYALSICLRYVSTQEANDGLLRAGRLRRHAPRPDLGGSLRGWLKKIMVRTAIDRSSRGGSHHPADRGRGPQLAEKTFDGFVKYRVLEQTTGARPTPVSIALLASVAVATALTADYYYLLPGNTARNFRNALGVGVDLETGGHVFQLHVTNALGMTEKFFVPGTTGNFVAGDLYFGFTVARSFTVRPQW